MATPVVVTSHTRHRFTFNILLRRLRLQSSFYRQEVRLISGGFRNAKESVECEATFSNGRSVQISTGKLARFADGCAVARTGDTSVMVTAVGKGLRSSSSPTGGGMVPLTVDFRLKAAAAGRIPTNHLRRELGPSQTELLAGRAIDRSLRPLFSQEGAASVETQVVSNVLAVDGKHEPLALAINAASAALAISPIPWGGPVGAVRVAQLRDGHLVTCPTRRELEEAQLDLLVAAMDQNLLVMVEGGARDVMQQDFMKALKVGVQECQHVVKAIQRLQKEAGKAKKEVAPPSEATLAAAEKVREAVRSLAEVRLREIFRDSSHDKISRDEAVAELRASVLETLREEGVGVAGVAGSGVEEAFGHIARLTFRHLVLETDLRCDGRGLAELRPINCQVDVFPPLHGSALFQRGQTQVLCTLAFDSPDSALKADTVSALTGGVKEKNFFLHYEFPPYATNETGRVGGPGRREVGHGALAEKALRPVVPPDFPFAIRLSAEVLESNGSSSMASVCGGSLALMDAGVPISAPVAGVAVGLVTKYSGDDTKHLEDYRLLTDILGIEDYMGDMDFKLAGTRKGITAVQADVKIPGLPLKVVMEAVQQAGEAKSRILNLMAATLAKPRDEGQRKPNWPVVERIEVPAHKRAQLVGFGGINLRRLTALTGVQLTSLEDGAFSLFAPSQAARDEARERMERLMEEQKEPQLDFGAVYSARVLEIRDTGVMVSLHPALQPALLHNSQLDQRPVKHPSALGLEVGQQLLVKYFGRDPVSGRIRISRKVLQGPASAAVKDLNG